MERCVSVELEQGVVAAGGTMALTCDCVLSFPRKFDLAVPDGSILRVHMESFSLQSIVLTLGTYNIVSSYLIWHCATYNLVIMVTNSIVCFG